MSAPASPPALPRLVGMVHAGAMPGTPRARLGVDALARAAADEARALADAGFDAVLVENMHDVPYLRRDVGPEIVAAMTRIVGAVRDAIELPLGVQVLAGANRAALAVAHAAGASFVRCEGFAYAAVADEGLLDEADAGPLLRYRRAIGADAVRVLADVRKKHSSHAITADVPLSEQVRTLRFLAADGVVVTGAATGDPTALDELRTARDAADGLPVYAGSGVTEETVAAVLGRAHGVIVGSAIKAGGRWTEPVDAAAARRLVAAAGPAG